MIGCRMEISEDSLRDHIPYYLTQDAKDGLIRALRDFPHDTNYYSDLYKDRVLQGDAWTALGLINYEGGTRKEVKGVVLSNSCDIAPENKRDTPARIVFSPIIKLHAYGALLTRAGIPAAVIENKFQSIREQKVTTLFYLPPGCGLDEEYIALLDDVHTMPLSKFLENDRRVQIFTLSQVGFYLFLFKLSVHFCRFHEALARD